MQLRSEGCVFRSYLQPPTLIISIQILPWALLRAFEAQRSHRFNCQPPTRCLVVKACLSKPGSCSQEYPSGTIYLLEVQSRMPDSTIFRSTPVVFQSRSLLSGFSITSLPCSSIDVLRIQVAGESFDTPVARFLLHPSYQPRRQVLRASFPQTVRTF